MGQADARGSRLGTDTRGGIGTDERGRGREGKERKGKEAEAEAAARVGGCQVRAPHHDGEVQSVERPVGCGVLLLPGLLHAGAGEILPSACAPISKPIERASKLPLDGVVAPVLLTATSLQMSTRYFSGFGGGGFQLVLLLL